MPQDLPRRALLVIDVQREYIDGRMPIAFPPLDVSLSNIGGAIDAAHEAGIPVALVQHVGNPGDPVFAPGSRGVQLHELVTDRPHDTVVEKRLVSAFVGTPLADWLAERGVDTLAIAGYMTQNCNESTARDASDRGLAVELLADASGTLPLATPAGDISAQALHERSLVALASRFAAVVTTEAWSAAIRTGAPLPRPSLWRSTEPARA